MNLDYKELIPEDFSDNSRVWVYQSSRLFSLSEALNLENTINGFCADWKSHGADVKAFGTLFFGQFLVLIADESRAMVSGCSTDSSVRFVKSIGEQYGVDFFNRTNLAFIIKESVQMLPMNQLKYAFDNGFITADTLYFNNTVTTKKQLMENWLIPVKESWLATKLGLQATT